LVRARQKVESIECVIPACQRLRQHSAYVPAFLAMAGRAGAFSRSAVAASALAKSARSQGYYGEVGSLEMTTYWNFYETINSCKIEVVLKP